MLMTSGCGPIGHAGTKSRRNVVCIWNGGNVSGGNVIGGNDSGGNVSGVNDVVSEVPMQFKLSHW